MKDEFRPDYQIATGTFRKREMWRQLARLDTDAEWFENQIQRIKDGASLETLAEALGVNYSIYRNWIRGNENRESALAEAVRERKARQMERVLQRTFDTALAHIEEPPKRADALRATEILLAYEKSGGGNGQAPSINLNISFVEAKDGKPVERVIDQVP